VLKLVRILSFVLAVLWLPLTAHCELESIGTTSSENESDDCCEPTNGCIDDACGLIEGENFVPTHTVLKARLPELKVAEDFFCFIALTLINETEPDGPAWGSLDQTLGWTATWSFTRRTAPPVRAPSDVA